MNYLLKRRKMSFRQLPVHQPRKRFMYHGYKIVIMNNGSQYFKFEWVIKPPQVLPRHLRIFPTPYTDPTSHLTLEAAIYFAKCAVNTMRVPNWNMA